MSSRDRPSRLNQFQPARTIQDMLAERPSFDPDQAVRQVLDGVRVPERLRHVQDFVWRGGSLRFVAAPHGDVCYELRAAWSRPVLEHVPSDAGLMANTAPVVEGKWVRGDAGYLLKVGIDLAMPSSIYLRTERRLLSCVPFINRPLADVERALATDLDAYVDWFLRTCTPVPLLER